MKNILIGVLIGVAVLAAPEVLLAAGWFAIKVEYIGTLTLLRVLAGWIVLLGLAGVLGALELHGRRRATLMTTK